MLDMFEGNGHCPQTLSLHLLVERAKGASSFWAPFVARLPDQVRQHTQTQRQSAQVPVLPVKLAFMMMASQQCCILRAVSSRILDALAHSHAGSVLHLLMKLVTHVGCASRVLACMTRSRSAHNFHVLRSEVVAFRQGTHCCGAWSAAPGWRGRRWRGHWPTGCSRSERCVSRGAVAL